MQTPFVMLFTVVDQQMTAPTEANIIINCYKRQFSRALIILNANTG
ncbi:hypothetical protein [Oceanicoccus sp. KOV_DT_Chl]|nr:hypothetical protein [Oceanicoccus sp. KOV_DT_Chl]